MKILLALLLSIPVLCVKAEYTHHYDDLIKQAANKYLPGVDWRLYRAQLIKESSLIPTRINRRSGAAGISQFMPATWKFIKNQLEYPSHATPLMPEYAIPAGAYLMGRILRYWREIEDWENKYKIALASYNAGKGNIRKAYNRSGKSQSYEDVIYHLVYITGSKNQRETYFYVKNIWETWENTLIHEQKVVTK